MDEEDQLVVDDVDPPQSPHQQPADIKQTNQAAAGPLVNTNKSTNLI